MYIGMASELRGDRAESPGRVQVDKPGRRLSILGSCLGSFEGWLKGSFTGSLKGSFKGFLKGSFKGSFKGSLQRHNEAQWEAMAGDGRIAPERPALQAGQPHGTDLERPSSELIRQNPEIVHRMVALETSGHSATF